MAGCRLSPLPRRHGDLPGSPELGAVPQGLNGWERGLSGGPGYAFGCVVRGAVRQQQAGFLRGAVPWKADGWPR